MRKGLLRALHVVLPALLACHPSTGTVTTDTLPGGIVRVQSTGPTEWVDTAGWRLVRELVIRPEEESGVAFGRGGMVVADEASGDIYVLDRGPAVIKRFDQTGRFLVTIGREGAGPGGFRDYGTLYLVDSLLVHHSHQLGRFALFSPDGRYLRAFPSISQVGMQLRSDRLGRIPVVIFEARPDGSGREGLVRYRIDGTFGDTLWYPDAPPSPTWEVQQGPRSLGTEIPFTTTQESALDREGDLVWGDQGKGSFVVSRTGADTLRTIDAAFPAAPLTDAERQRAVDSLTATGAWLVGVANVKDVPTVRPRWDFLEADGNGDLWVHRALSAKEARWSVLAPDGRWIGDVPAPFGEVTSSFWGKDRVYVLTENGDGFPQVEVWRIDRTLR